VWLEIQNLRFFLALQVKFPVGQESVFQARIDEYLVFGRPPDRDNPCVAYKNPSFLYNRMFCMRIQSGYFRECEKDVVSALPAGRIR